MTMHKIFLGISASLLWISPMQAEVGQDVVGDDATIWIALFGLAVIGIFALYLSSEKVKELTRKYTAMHAAQHEIETRQNILLGVIGERLENSTLGIRRHREVFEGQSSETLDWEAISSEMTRFRRDESLLLDAMQDLQDFSRIRLEKLQLERSTFGINEMLKRLSQKVEPHYLLKHNELVYRFDPTAIKQIHGDARRIEQILGTFLVELGQELYDSTVILSIGADRDEAILTFDVQIPQGDIALQMREDILVEWGEGASHPSTRKLKNYIAHELIRLIGGTLRSIPNAGEEVHYRIALPLRVEADPSPEALPDAPLLIVSHSEPTALSVNDMLVGKLPQTQITRFVLGDETLHDLAVYETVVITYAALNEAWVHRLHSLQQAYPLRVIVLKNGFERNLPVPDDIDVAQTLRLPLLPDKLLEAMAKDPVASRQDAVAS